MKRMEPVRVAVFISGNGSNLQAILDAILRRELRAEVVLVVSSKADAFGLTRAKQSKIPTFVAPVSSEPESEQHLLEALTNARVECILLAGYIRKISSLLLNRYNGRIVNIHPALLPKFGGKGMYGHHVHEAVLAAEEKSSGATVHLVNEQYDTGKILAQESLIVLPDDSAATLAARVLKIEHALYPRAVQQFLEQEFGCASVASARH